jgi:hypothetical protein
VNLLDLIRDQAKVLRSGEETPVEADWPADREALWLVLGEAETLAKAAGRVLAAARAQLADTLEANESVRFGDTIYKTSPDRKERIIDPAGLIDWLGDDWHHIVPVTSSTRLKVGGFRAIAEKRGLDFATVRDTFIDVEYGPNRLVAIPIAKAPKYAQKLSHAESTLGRR